MDRIRNPELHRYGKYGTVPEDQKLVLCLGLDPEEDLETLLLVGRGEQGELRIVDIRQDVSPTRINTRQQLFFLELRVRQVPEDTVPGTCTYQVGTENAQGMPGLGGTYRTLPTKKYRKVSQKQGLKKVI